MSAPSADRARRQGIDAIGPTDLRGSWKTFNAHIVDDIGSGAIQVIRADDIAVWRNAQVNASSYREEDFTLEALTDVRPPWPVTWIEYPSRSGRERRVVLISDHNAAGIELAEFEMYDVLDRAAMNDAVTKGVPRERLGTTISMLIWVDNGRRVQGPLGMVVLALDVDGRVAGNRWVWLMSRENPLGSGQKTVILGEADDGSPLEVEPWEWLLAAMDTAMVTTDLLNMVNVDTELVAAAPTTRRHRRRGAHPPVRYRVLRFKLPGGRYERMDGSTPGHEPLAIHKVRGHPAHYGDCCPGLHKPRGLLFGKLTGRYWIPGHLRGNPEAGVVDGEAEATIR